MTRAVTRARTVAATAMAVALTGIAACAPADSPSDRAGASSAGDVRTTNGDADGSVDPSPPERTASAGTESLPETAPPTTVRNPSPGCTDPVRQWPTDATWRVDLDDGSRSYLIAQRPSIVGTGATGVVVLLHGLGSDGATVLEYSGMAPAAERLGAIVVLPEAVDDRRRWSLDDLPYLQAVLDHVERTRCIDRDRVWLAGLSMGGFMGARMACDGAGRFSALATVAGTGFDPAACAGVAPMPVLAFHGTADHVVPYAGPPPDFVDVVPSAGAEADLGAWAAHNGCGAVAEVVRETDEVSTRRWPGCAADTVLFTVQGGGHSWPGAEPHERQGYTTDDISATDLMVEFFAKHAGGPSPG